MSDIPPDRFALRDFNQEAAAVAAEIHEAEREVIEAARRLRRQRIGKSGLAPWQAIKWMDDALDRLDALEGLKAMAAQRGRG